MSLDLSDWCVRNEGLTLWLCALLARVAHLHHFMEYVRHGRSPKDAALTVGMCHPRLCSIVSLGSDTAMAFCAGFQLMYTSLFGAYATFIFLRTGWSKFSLISLAYLLPLADSCCSVAYIRPLTTPRLLFISCRTLRVNFHCARVLQRHGVSRSFLLQPGKLIAPLSIRYVTSICLWWPRQLMIADIYILVFSFVYVDSAPRSLFLRYLRLLSPPDAYDRASNLFVGNVERDGVCNRARACVRVLWNSVRSGCCKNLPRYLFFPSSGQHTIEHFINESKRPPRYLRQCRAFCCSHDIARHLLGWVHPAALRAGCVPHRCGGSQTLEEPAPAELYRHLGY